MTEISDSRGFWVLLIFYLLVIAALGASSFSIGYTSGYNKAWDRQEARRLECGQGWWDTMNALNICLQDYEE